MESIMTFIHLIRGWGGRPNVWYLLFFTKFFKVKDSTKIRLIQSLVQALITERVDFRSIQINRKPLHHLPMINCLFFPFFLLESQPHFFYSSPSIQTKRAWDLAEVAMQNSCIGFLMPQNKNLLNFTAGSASYTVTAAASAENLALPVDFV